MRVSYGALAGAGLLLLVASAPLSGQSYRGTLGLFGGGSWFSDLTPTGATETRLETNWLAGLHMERWLGAGRVGFRLGGAYADRALATPNHSRYNLYTGDLSLLVRLLPPEPGRGIAPYLAVGGGALHVNALAGPSLAANFYEDPVTKPLVTAGLGTDLFASSPLGFQLEAADQVLLESPFGDPAANTKFQPIHHAVVRLALQIRGSRLPAARPIYAAAPPRRAQAEPAQPTPAELVEPEPAPEPTPAPVPEPEPAQPVVASQPVVVAAAPELNRVKAAVDANTAELERLRTRVVGLERAASDRPAGSAPRTTASGSTQRLYTVQVGAYRDANAARGMADSMRKTGLPVWVSSVTVNGRTVHRVRLGAARSHTDAVRLAQQVKSRFPVQIWVAPVEASDDVPANAVSATRASLDNGS